MGSPINWANHRIGNSNLYLKYASTTFGNITISDVKADIKLALASNESAEIVAYLAWLIRILELID